MAAHTLREVQPIIGVASATAVEPSLQLLRSLHVDVQQEGGWGLVLVVQLVTSFCSM